MNNVDKLLIKNDLPENEYEKFRIYSEVFYNVPPISKHPANTALPSDPISLNLVPT